MALVEGYKTVYPCYLDSYTVTMCKWVPSHCSSDTVQLSTRYLVTRFLNGPHRSRYPVLLVCHVVTVQLSLHWGLDNGDYIVTEVAVTASSG